MSRIWSRPPALKAEARLGLAKRRSLATFGASTAFGWACAAGLTSLGRATGFACVATCLPALAGAVGAGSFFGSPSSRLTALAETFSGFGTGYSVASLARWPYVYVLP